jgi:predicted RNA-binding Zn-ribbon protein involved in translation (DUF1610 family)
MPVSPVRDIVGILAGLVLILLVPFVLSISIFQVTAIPITESFQLQIVSGDLSHSYFVSLLGMSQLSYDLLSTQLGTADLLSRMFAAIASDWAALSVALFLLTGILAAWALGSDLERIAIPAAIGLVALAMGVLFVEGFVRGITGLEDFTRMGLANALNMLVVVSYGMGTLFSGLTSFGLGRLFHRGAEKHGAVQGPVGPVAVAKAAGAEATKAATTKEEPAYVAGKEVVPERETLIPTEGAVKSAPAEMTPETTGTEQVKALSASEAAQAGEIEEIVRQARESSVQPLAPQQSVPETEQVPPSVRRSTAAPLPERLEHARESRDIFTALEEPMQRISSRVEREPGAVWRPIPCPVCGSELTWSREKQAYYCPFCGTVP